MNFFAAFVACYFLGSVPTAYLLVRYKFGIDIRKAGSGNVGAFNAFDVTRSKTGGIIVGLLDALKGFTATAALVWLFRAPFEIQATGLVGAMLGHNYPVWLRFRGGRGLATAAGGLFAIGLTYTIVWCVLWVVVYRLKKNIHAGSLVATLIAPVVVLLMPASWIEFFTIANCPARSFQIFGFVLSGIIFLSHADILNELRTKGRLGNE